MRKVLKTLFWFVAGAVVGQAIGLYLVKTGRLGSEKGVG